MAAGGRVTDPTRRFSDRVDTYVRARPGYPAEVVDVLRERAGLGPGSVVADVGAGTGIFTRLLAATGARVHAVEPNEAMLAALIESLGPTSTVRTHRRPAEATNLSPASIDLITAAQAFHWFDRDAVGAEFRRILRPTGAVAIIWNGRVTTTPFTVGYEELLRRWATDLGQVDHRQIPREDVAAFFRGGPVEVVEVDNHQLLDRGGLRDRLLSSSYAPPPGHPDHEPMLADLDRLFDAHAVDGQVRLEYRTELHLGRFA